MNTFLRSTFLRGLATIVLVAGFSIGKLWAQSLEKDAVTIPIILSGGYQPFPPNQYPYYANLGVQLDSNYIYYHVEYTAYGGSIGPAQFSVKPGKNYLLNVWQGQMSWAQVKFQAPAGYVVYLGGVRRTTIGGVLSTNPLPGLISLRVEQEEVTGFGVASSLRPGRIVWTVGMGNLLNGRSAGVMSLRRADLAAEAYSPAALDYDSSSPEVEKICESDGTMRQVYTTNGLVDIIGESWGFRVKFYPRNTGQIGALDGGRYTVTGDPLYEYFVENPDAPTIGNRLRITRTARQGGATLETWTEMAKMGTQTDSPYSVMEWVEKPSGATSVISPVRKICTSPEGNSTLYVGDGTNSQFDYTQGTGVVYQEFRGYSSLSWGKELSVFYRNTGEDTQSVTYTSGRVTKLASQGLADTFYDYYSDGMPYTIRKPFLNTDASATNFAVGEVTTYGYTAAWDNSGMLPSSVETKINNTLSKKTEFSYAYEDLVDTSRDYGSTANATMKLVVETKKEYSDPSNYLTTISKTFRDDSDIEKRFFPRLPHSVKRPDGTMSVTVYFRGTFSNTTRLFTAAKNGPEVLVLTLNGTSISSSESTPLTSFTAGAPLCGSTGDHTQATEADFRIVPGVSTAGAIVRAADGTTIATASLICTGTTSAATWQVVQRDVHYFTAQFFLEHTSRDSGDPSVTWNLVTNGWTKGRLDYTIDEAGVRTDFTYDSSNRLRTRTKQGATLSGVTIGTITSTYDYDAAGHMIAETMSASGTTETLVKTWTYDKAGRLTGEAVPGQSAASTTSYGYGIDMFVHRYVQKTLPNAATHVEKHYPDGRLESITGTSVVAEYYDYAIETDGTIRTTVRQGSSSSSRFRQSWSDMLGRPVKTSQPGFTGQSASESTNSYDSSGRLVQTAKTGLAPTRNEYNVMGQRIRSGLDIDATTGLQTNSATDRITDSSEFFESFDGAWWLTTVQSGYPTPSSATAVELGRKRERLTGLSATLRGETRSYDAEGNETRVMITADVTNRVVTTTTKRPGMAADQIEKSLNGLSLEATAHTGLTTRKRYDALSRLVSVIEPRTGTESNPSTKISYYPNTTLTKEVKDGANKRLSFSSYDSAGRVIYTEDALGKTTRTAYTARGEIDKVWGTATYPVSYVYSDYGERTKLRTYRDASNASTTDTTSFPSLSTYDETTWEFDGPSGLLKKKTDAKGKLVEYTYNARGQTAERYWSRTLPNATTRVKATFAYFGDAAGEPKTGELKSITYNDGTPTVSYTYTRSGQTNSAGDAATGVHDFIYDSAKPWRLAAEALDSFQGSRVLTRSYESATSMSAGTLASHTLATVVGRTAGLKLGTSSTPAADLEFSYPISNTGRVAGVVSARGNGAASRTFTYGYDANSDLLKSLAIAGGHPFTITRDFETYRDLVTSVEAKWTTARTKFAYAYDDRRQRASVVQSGDVFNDYGGADNGAIHQIFTYNGRGELTGAGTFLGATATDQSQPLSARKHEFDYDGIGNRRWSNTSGNSAVRDDYTVNELNQYTLRENNTLAVGGTVANDSNIKVAAGATATQLAGRQGRHWGDNIALENTYGAYQGDLTIYAVNPTTNKKMTETRTAFIPPVAQTFSYDEDGNVTSDGVWTYEWDAENRLIGMQTTANAISGGVPAQRLEFKYDYLHRRVEKLVRAGWNGSSFTTVTSQKRFLYDGWSLIAEFSVSGGTLTLARSYTWGLDIAKSLTDAGGVGALLQIHDYAGNKDYLPSYDGNGNIGALFDADTSQNGACVAAYEYSPYGEFLRCEGTYAKENPFRFSTKFTDDETGLVYYGRRYYSPSQGRFLGRDPAEDGLNLYAFTRNNPINRWDVNGLYVIYPNTDGGFDLFDDTDSGNVLLYSFSTREAAEQAMSQIGNTSTGIDFAGIDAQNQLVNAYGALAGPSGVWVNPVVVAWNAQNPFGSSGTVSGSITANAFPSAAQLACVPAVVQTIVTAVTGANPGDTVTMNQVASAINNNSINWNVQGVPPGQWVQAMTTAIGNNAGAVALVLPNDGFGTAAPTTLNLAQNVMDSASPAGIVVQVSQGSSSTLHAITVQYDAPNNTFYVTNLLANGGVVAVPNATFTSGNLSTGGYTITILPQYPTIVGVPPPNG